MRNSEIFNNFIKIAEEKGLIDKNAPEKAIKKLENNPRMDSLSIKDIEKLYGVKPDAPKGMEYTRNIIEDAHPNPSVVSPSYDRLNGLVENNNERQDIILNKINKNNKTPNGQLENHKWAQNNLVLNLVRVANDLDNKNIDQLRVLADTCLFQLSDKSLKKTALPIAIPIIAGVAAVLGLLYAQQHMDFINEGFQRNHEKLISEIDDLINSNSNYEVGVQYKPEFIQTMSAFKSKLVNLNGAVNRYIPIIDQLEKPKDAKELIQISKGPETNSVLQAFEALRAQYFNILPTIKEILNNFNSQDYKSRQIVEKGAITNLVDRVPGLHGGKGLISDDFDDVKNALNTYKASFLQIIDILKKSGSIKQQALKELTDSANEAQSEIPSEAPTQENASPGASQSPENDQLSKLDDLEKSLPPELG